MVFIPGFVIAALTFPGVVVHETAHLWFCKRFRLAVFDVCFFQFGNPSGYVIHERTDNFTAIFFVSMGPLFINSLGCLLFCSAAFLPVWEFEVADPLFYFFCWLGISLGIHAFPSTADLSNIWSLAKPEAVRGNLLAIISFPIIALFHVLNALRVVWADLAYGVAVGLLAPLAIWKLLA